MKKMKLPEAEVQFRRGFAVALGILHHGFGEPNQARRVMEEANYSLKDLEEAGCEEHDLEGIREVTAFDTKEST